MTSARGETHLSAECPAIVACLLDSCSLMSNPDGRCGGRKAGWICITLFETWNGAHARIPLRGDESMN